MTPVLHLDALWIDEMRAVEVEGVAVVVIRHEQGVCAYVDRCPHLGVPISAGGLADGIVTCHAHGFRFDAVTGVCLNPTRLRLRPVSAVIRDARVCIVIGGEDAG